MRIAVVGASNCILKGNFVTILEQSAMVTQIDNFSLGGSSSVLLPYTLMQRQMSDYDVVIVDVMINEYTFTASDKQTVQAGLRHIREFAQYLAALDIPCIFTLMPHRDLFDQQDFDFVRIYSEAARLLNWHYIDLFEAAAAAIEMGVPRSDLWVDRTHISPQMQRILANRILAFLAVYKEHKAFLGLSPQTLSIPQPQCAAAELRSPSGEGWETLQHASSLVSPTYLKLPIETPISFDARSGHIFGIAYNSIQFLGKLDIVTDFGSYTCALVDRDAETLTHKPGFDFRHRVLPIQTIAPGSGAPFSGEVTFQPAPNCPAKHIEIECLFGGPSPSIGLGNTGRFFEDPGERALLLNKAA